MHSEEVETPHRNDTKTSDAGFNLGRGRVRGREMRRREFLKTGVVAAAAAAPFASRRANAFVPAHNWSNYNFGSGPPVTDRLNQGPFPQYPPDSVIPTDEVVMTTTPSEEAVPNYGKGLVTYITADMGTEEIKVDNVSQGIEDLV